ncbi:hypothetical protein ACJRO7_035708 [Eucalyptus globulus]|uniref:Uncharacterized protein n=1 Tax=Eucalyptus globulus TaxID=34317 RepID=A0ABD3J9V4_EUCGL
MSALPLRRSNSTTSGSPLTEGLHLHNYRSRNCENRTNVEDKTPYYKLDQGAGCGQTEAHPKSAPGALFWGGRGFAYGDHVEASNDNRFCPTRNGFDRTLESIGTQVRLQEES